MQKDCHFSLKATLCTIKGLRAASRSIGITPEVDELLVDMLARLSLLSYLTFILLFVSEFSVYITETTPYSCGNFRKLSLYNSFMPI